MYINKEVQKILDDLQKQYCEEYKRAVKEYEKYTGYRYISNWTYPNLKPKPINIPEPKYISKDE